VGGHQLLSRARSRPPATAAAAIAMCARSDTPAHQHRRLDNPNRSRGAVADHVVFAHARVPQSECGGPRQSAPLLAKQAPDCLHNQQYPDQQQHKTSQACHKHTHAAHTQHAAPGNLNDHKRKDNYLTRQHPCCALASRRRAAAGVPQCRSGQYLCDKRLHPAPVLGAPRSRALSQVDAHGPLAPLNCYSARTSDDSPLLITLTQSKHCRHVSPLLLLPHTHTHPHTHSPPFPPPQTHPPHLYPITLHHTTHTAPPTAP